MKKKKRNGRAAAAALTFFVLAFHFALMPSALATPPDIQTVQTFADDTEDLQELPDSTQTQNDSDALPSLEDNLNSISREGAVKNAMEALASAGFDLQDFESQPMETRYMAGTAPAGDPVWMVIFRDDQQGYASAFGDQVDDATREKIAAVGEIEPCSDENGVAGIRAYYSYTCYTLVEINAANGKYIRHGSSIVELGAPLHLDETNWTFDTGSEPLPFGKE